MQLVSLFTSKLLAELGIIVTVLGKIRLEIGKIKGRWHWELVRPQIG